MVGSTTFWLTPKNNANLRFFIRKIHPVVSKTPAARGMELDGIEAVRLFKLLDADGNGAIEIDEQLYCKRFWQY